MRVFVSGAFSAALVAELASCNAVILGGAVRRISAVLVCGDEDAAVSGQMASHRRVHAVAGQPGSAEMTARIVQDAPELVIHLASAPFGLTATEIGGAVAACLRETVGLLDLCRQLPRPPVLVLALPPAFLTGAGQNASWKAAIISLLRDATRQGFVRGRMLHCPLPAATDPQDDCAPLWAILQAAALPQDGPRRETAQDARGVSVMIEL